MISASPSRVAALHGQDGDGSAEISTSFLLNHLLSRFEYQDGPIGLSVVVEPALPVLQEEADEYHLPVPQRDETDEYCYRPVPGHSRQTRNMALSLRLWADRTVPTTLLATAAALCRNLNIGAGDWELVGACEELELARKEIALEDHRPHFGTVDQGTSAAALAVPLARSSRIKRLYGRPWLGDLPREGTEIGRVPRISGRSSAWRLSWQRRTEHVLLIGGPGSGTRNTLLRLIKDDVAAGRSIVMIDTQGDIAYDAARMIPARDRIIIDPIADRHCGWFSEPKRSRRMPSKRLSLLVSLPLATLGSHKTRDLADAALTQMVTCLNRYGHTIPAQANEISVFINEIDQFSLSRLRALLQQRGDPGCSITAISRMPSRADGCVPDLMTAAGTRLVGRLSEDEASHLGKWLTKDELRLVTTLPPNHLLLSSSFANAPLGPVLLSPSADFGGGSSALLPAMQCSFF